MAQFLITYIGNYKPATPQEGKAHFSRYMNWLQGLGDKAISPANPIKDTVTISPDGTIKEESVTTMSGYTIVEVDTLDAAIAIAKACPFLEVGGSLEVSELIDMPAL